MKKYLVPALAIFIASCANPIGPTDANTVTLSMLVMGNRTQQPLVGVPVTLVGPGNQASTKMTGSDGRATWRVTSNTQYSMSACGTPTLPSRITADAGWLTSLPEERRGR